MRKRSTKVAIGIVGAAAFALAGCQEEQVEAQAFPDLASCRAAASETGIFSGDGANAFSAADCETAVKEAETLHVETAPRYDSLEVCEEQHGSGACGTEAEATSGGSGGIFMPLLAGYLIGNMLSGRSGLAGSQPLYRTADGRFSNPAGASTYSSNSGRAQLNASNFSRPQATLGRAPMTKATVASRGGFGKIGGLRGGFGG